jgi:subtilase family serine protease
MLTADLDAEDALFEQAAAQGQTVVAASGDAGSEDCTPDDPARLAVDDPASQPYVTGVGGTALTFAPAPAETVWNDASGAGGGGISQHWPMPAFQRPAVASPAAGRCRADACRTVPDVAADASPANGYLVYINGHWAAIGGTSAAAPLWAALVALADASAIGGCTPATPLGFLNPALYGLAGSDGFRDVTAGDNDYTGQAHGSYTAGPGYDLATGLGTPLAYLAPAEGLVPGLCATVARADAHPAAGGDGHARHAHARRHARSDGLADADAGAERGRA